MITLEATKRDTKTNLDELRSEGIIPAVFYGPKEATTSIAVKEPAFIKAYKEAGESSVITLKEGASEHEALIHDVQFDAVTDRPKHIDFYVIEKGKKVSVFVPLEFTGVSPAEKDLGGILIKVLHELEIEAMPKDLPHELTVDISAIKDFDTQILAKDIKLPAGVELLADPEEPVALAQAAKEIDVEESTDVDMDAIEVETKGKGEEADAESSEGDSE